MLEAAGAKNVTTFAAGSRPRLRHPRGGRARAWATDPKQSVLNQFQQTHDVKNLFVMDGAGFPSGGVPEPDADHHGAGGAVDVTI